MEIKKSAEKITNTLKKYKHAVLVVVIGLVLMMIPNHKTVKNTVKTDMPVNECETSTDEQRLTEILRHISGVGEVQVMLTVMQGEEILYQTNTDTSSDGDSQAKEQTTVTVTNGSRSENGLVRQRIPPKYQGAIVVCSGGNDPAIQLAVVDAVSKATGLGANSISVLKMK